ncbi:hypothetical protein N665_0605s0002 [Sinapis alba]|nr:hypothetical protein N665_0605s0002 [Sinapis alba]
MSSPIRRCSLKEKAIATASDSDNSSSPRLLGPRAITLGGMIPRPTSEDLAELNENERSIVQFSLDLEEREASQPEKRPPTAKDKASAEKEISLHLADLVPMRWTGTDFEFDEEIDPEQERHQSACGILVPHPGGSSKTLTPPAGYACVYESWFTNCSLWWPLPEFLTTYCHRRRIALGQYTANGIRILVTLTILAAELGITMLARLFEELTTPSITAKTGFFYGKMVPKYNEVEAIRTLSHQHWPDISEARIQAALKRISRGWFADVDRPAKRRRPTNAEEETRRSSPTQSPLTEGPIGNADDNSQQQGLSREELPLLSPAIPVGAATAEEMPLGEHLVDPQAIEVHDEQPAEPDLANHEDVVGYPHVIDFRYQHTSVPFVEDNEAPARLFWKIQLKRKGMPELEELSQSNRYREMTRTGAIFFGSANLMVRDYEAKLKAQDEKIASKTGALKKKRREIAELAYKCGSYKEQIGTLGAEKIAAVENAEALSKEIEELKALKGGLETRCHNLEQENAEILLRFETTTRRLRESREHEVRKERLRVESILKNQIAPAYDKMRQFVEEQPSIQSKLAL